MNNVRHLAVALVALTATPALAQPAEEGPITHTDQLIVVTPNPPVVITNGAASGAGPGSVAPVPSQAPGAPQNEDWNNVNHINGQIVKVGEKTDYLIKAKKTNISANPFGLFFGYYDIAASRALSQHVALSGSLAGWSRDDYGTGDTGFQATVSAPIYFRRTFSGPFLEPGLIVRSSSQSYSAYDCYGCSASSHSNSWAGPELLFGWHWTFDSGLNIAMAFGVAKHMTDNQMSTDGYSSSSDQTDANGYFRVGYAF